MQWRKNSDDYLEGFRRGHVAWPGRVGLHVGNPSEKCLAICQGHMRAYACLESANAAFEVIVATFSPCAKVTVGGNFQNMLARVGLPACYAVSEVHV
jgi:hypothetical protein